MRNRILAVSFPPISGIQFTYNEPISSRKYLRNFVGTFLLCRQNDPSHCFSITYLSSEDLLKTSQVLRKSKEEIKFMWRTVKRGCTDVDHVDNPELVVDDENEAWSENELEDMLQVGDITVI